MKRNIIIALVLIILAVAIPITIRASSLISFDPQTATAATGTNFTTNLVVTNTTGSDVNITGYKLIVNFDKTVLNVKNISYKVGQRSASLNGDGDGSAANLADINSRGQILLWGEITDPSGKTLSAGLNTSFVEITFTAVKQDSTTISTIVNTSYLKIIKPDSSLDNLALPSASMTVNQGGSTPPSSLYTTTDFRISEDPSLDPANGDTSTSPAWDQVPTSLRFRYNPNSTNQFDYTFLPQVCVTQPCDPYPRGVRTVFVLFIGHDRNNQEKRQVEKNFILLAKPPVISGANCEISVTGAGSVVTINGLHFGDSSVQGSVAVTGNTLSSITTWSNERVVANLSNTISGTPDVTVTTAEGQTSNRASCAIGASRLDFTASLACRTAQPLSQAELEVLETNISIGVGSTASLGVGTSAVSTGTVFPKANVSFDRDGRAQIALPNLIEGKAYKLILKARNALRKVVSFVAAKGTSVLGNAEVAVGDVYPDRGDCIVNTFDVSEMTRSWSLDKDVQRKADLNGDNRVNSIDYSCLVNNFNKTCDSL